MLCFFLKKIHLKTGGSQHRNYFVGGELSGRSVGNLSLGNHRVVKNSKWIGLREKLYHLAPPVISWFINPIKHSYLRTINHSEIGVICTNLAIQRGPHIVPCGPRYVCWILLVHKPD